ncbi:hypothetical protein [Paenibacillus arenosi]|uniref:Uncharacterized protein n=1 Tax=Paenibacillus arenosi TaxID=2774142 RepID=A0ABR9B001_9BACL|nr:hypothetical protein [Paenibacillus arenosi]MBD8498785.1 hypothetical protein [Paenibacillus arenosi]
MVNPVEFLTELRNSDTFIADIYMKGSCYKLFRILKLLYPHSIPYKCGNENDYYHVITSIDNVFYDIKGIVDPLQYDSVVPMLIEDQEEFEWYSYSRMWYIPDCEECPVMTAVTAHQLEPEEC